jgi:hypothetical protein
MPSLHKSEIGYEAWLKSHNEDVKKRIVATDILLFDFELPISGRPNCHEYQPISSGHIRWSDLALASTPGLFSSLE